VIPKRSDGLDNFVDSLNTFKNLGANTYVHKDSKGNFKSANINAKEYSNSQLVKDLNDFARSLIQRIDSDLAKALGSDDENFRKRVFEEIKWVNHEFESALAGKGTTGGLQGLLETYKGDNEAKNSLEKTIEEMKSRLGTDLKAIKAKIDSPVKGLKFNNVNDIKEYYTAHLLPQKQQLPPEEFSKRCIILLDQAFTLAHKELYKEMGAHRLVLTPDAQLLNSERAKPEWLNEFEALCTLLDVDTFSTVNYRNAFINHAMIYQESAKLQQPDSTLKVANWMCEIALKKEPVSLKKIKIAQLDALEKFSEHPNWRKMLPQDLRNELINLKKHAIFTANGIPPQDQQNYFALLPMLEEMWKKVQERGDEVSHQKMESLNLPPFNREPLVAHVKDEIEKMCIINFKILISLALKKNPSELWTLKKEFDEANERVFYFQSIQADHLSSVQFFNKWSGCLKAEMIQGFKNPGEVLGAGVCCALATRWSVAELKKEKWGDMTQVLDDLGIGNVEARDRLNQVVYYTVFKRTGSLEKSWKKIESKMGVTHAESLKKVSNISGKAALMEYSKALISSPEFATLYNGVGRLDFFWQGGAHAITICCQEDADEPGNSVFRIIDPNCGAFQFHVKPEALSGGLAKKQFVDCLSDLLLLYANNFNEVQCRCFKVK
jgi:hypothetical protein